jgi:hypothetical protein
MNEKQDREWVAQCAHRLRERWRTVAPCDLEAIAEELRLDHELGPLPPSDAAALWLGRGLPNP